MEKKIIDKIKEVEGVEGVFVIREGDCLRVFTVVNFAGVDTRNKIYEKEMEAMDMYPEESFDFHVIDRKGRKLEELITFEEDVKV